VRVVEVVIVIAVLFGTGFGAGMAARVLAARRQAKNVSQPGFKPQFRFTSSLKASELCEDPIWGR
jgi:hypothetical protein